MARISFSADIPAAVGGRLGHLMEGTEMKKILNGIIAAVAAAVVSASLAVGAFADYIYDLSDSRIVDEIRADSKEIDGTEAKLTMDLGPSDSEDGISIRFALFNEYLDAEYWNDPNVTVSVDVKLETEGADVIGYIPAFDNKWNWINPTDFTTLRYGEWITISETGEHFYEGFKDNGPNRFCFQVRTNWGAPTAGVVTVSIRNFTISDGTSETVIEPETGETTASDTSETTVEANDPVQSDTNSSTPSESVSSPASTTSMVVADAPEDQITYVPVEPNAGKQTAMVIIIIVIIAVVIIAGAVVGYIIYKKRKYY